MIEMLGLSMNAQVPIWENGFNNFGFINEKKLLSTDNNCLNA